MYLWLFVAVGIVWLWLSGGSFAAWKTGKLGFWLSLLPFLAWTGIAGLVILFVGPYWRAVWEVLLQPGLV